MRHKVALFQVHEDEVGTERLLISYYYYYYYYLSVRLTRERDRDRVLYVLRGRSTYANNTASSAISLKSCSCVIKPQLMEKPLLAGNCDSVGHCHWPIGH